MKLYMALKHVRCGPTNIFGNGIKVLLITPTIRMSVNISGACEPATGVGEVLHPVHCAATSDWSEVEFSQEER